MGLEAGSKHRRVDFYPIAFSCNYMSLIDKSRDKLKSLDSTKRYDNNNLPYLEEGFRLVRYPDRISND